MSSLHLLSAIELVKLYRSRQASPVEATQAVLAQIDALNPLLNVFCWLDADAAMTAARDSEARWSKGEPLSAVDGVPTTVKDLSVTRDWPTRRGSLAISPRGPWLEDAPSVARMREAGAVLIGKTTVPEMGAWHLTKSALTGVTRSAWDPDKTPGGSSGGAAASLAAGMGTLALASDASGSIRVPSSYSGVVGLKTTAGIVPDYPSSYHGATAVIGPMARTVGDAALCMSIIGRPDWRDSYALETDTDAFMRVLEQGVAGLRIAYSPTLGFGSIEPEVAAIVADGVKLLESLGARIDIVDHVFDDPTAALEPIRLAGMANAFRQLGIDEADRKLMLPHLVERAERGARVSALDYLTAIEKREALGALMRRFHQTYDLLVLPVTATPALAADDLAPVEPRYAAYKSPIQLTAAFNMTKQPAASVPVGLTAAGQPVGMQIVGPLYSDALVLRACRAIETARPFAGPDLSRLRGLPAPAVPQGLAAMHAAQADGLVDA